LSTETINFQWIPQGGQGGQFFIDARNQHQQMDGVGASLTDSAAWLIKNKLDQGSRSNLIRDLFTQQGANLNFVRVPLSSSDIATSDFTHDDVDFPGTDPSLAHFKLNSEHDFNIPILQEMKNSNPSFITMGTAWSAPGWMKVNNQV
jgi:glucosylceramidase